MSLSDLMYPFEWIVAWIMYLWHGALTAVGMPEASGWTWTLSIVGLVIVMRAALIPLFTLGVPGSPTIATETGARLATCRGPSGRTSTTPRSTPR